MKNKIFLSSDLKILEKSFRTNLINCLSGFQSANLIGTKNKLGQTNLAIFNSVMHIGADPALMGFIARPSAELHTFNNILDTNEFTINAVPIEFFKESHQTSARFDKGVSEFEACGLTPEYSENCSAPYVKECKIKIGLKLAENYTIKSNGCHLVIGEIMEISIQEDLLLRDGYIDHNNANGLAVLGLDGYHTTQFLERLEYAKVIEK